MREFCEAVSSQAQSVDRVARAALAVLKEENPPREKMEACMRWISALLPVSRAFRRFKERGLLGRGEVFISLTYDVSMKLLHSLRDDFERRRNLEQLADDAVLARACVDALVPESRKGKAWAPSFSPLREFLVGWLCQEVAREDSGKIDFEHTAQACTARLWQRTERQVQDIVGRSRKWRRIEAPLLFPDLVSHGHLAGAVKK
jgi:hypothetical protein